MVCLLGNISGIDLPIVMINLAMIFFYYLLSVFNIFTGMSLKITTYNCQSANVNIDIIRSLCLSSHIVLLQETLLCNTNHSILGTVNDEFDYIYTSATRKPGVFVGRSSGGIAILWRKCSNIFIKPLYISNRLMGIKINDGVIEYLLINVYFNCDYGNMDSLIEYKSTIADLSNITCSESYDELVIVGDFNCDPHKGRFYKELKNFCSNFNIHICDVDRLPANSFTYISQNESCNTSWIDHILTSNSNIVENIDINYGTSFSDHIPLSFELKLSSSPIISATIYESNMHDLLILWEKASPEQIDQYALCLDELVSEFINSGIMCHTEMCHNTEHLNDLNVIFEFIKECIYFASHEFLPIKSVSRNNYKVVPGWNQFCRERYLYAKQIFVQWVNGGRIRNGALFDEMKRSRCEFKNALNYCKKNELRIRRENFLLNFKTRRMNRFWKATKKLNPKAGCSLTIDGKTDLNDVVNVFSSKYRGIFDDPNSRSTNITPVNHGDEPFHYLFLSDCIDNNIAKINTGLGFDMIHSNHIKYSHRGFRNFIARVFTSMVSHSFLPKEMLRGHIKPTLKNGKSCKTNSENYRPVMNSSVFLKLFEYSIIETISKSVKINPLQFGFTENSSCAKAITLLKETLLYYKKGGSNVHCASIDLSKAFDKINVSILISKLVQTDVPRPIINIISYMLQNTYANIRYANFIGKEFLVQNGVRQGGILSALLFNIYINDCINNVSSLNYGCRLNYQRVNIIAYADDIICIGPTASVLQKILNFMSISLKNLCLKINVIKSAYIIFKANKRTIHEPNLYIGQETLKTVT